MRSSGVLELPGSSEFSTWCLPGPAWREGRRLRPPVGTSSVRITLARRRGYPAAAALAIALVLGACTSSGPGPAANRPPGGVSTRCSVTPPNAACATEVAGGLGFPFAWLSPPGGQRHSRASTRGALGGLLQLVDGRATLSTGLVRRPDAGTGRDTGRRPEDR